MKNLSVNLTLIMITALVLACSKSPSTVDKDSDTYAISVAKTWGNSDTSKSGNDGEFVLDVVTLTKDEAQKLESAISAVPKLTRDNFIDKLSKLRAKYKAISSSGKSDSVYITNTTEYKDFNSLSLNGGKDGLTLFLGQIFNDVDVASGAILWGFDIYTFKYMELWKQVKVERETNLFTSGGAFIIYSDLSMIRRFGKKIIGVTF